MAKRFTETTKWDDSWFVDLPSEFKAAWIYLCDCCDIAGVMDLSERLANFRIGSDIDWEEFVNATNGRVEMLENGKLWIVGFCEFQYGRLTEKCNAHLAVIRLLNKHGIEGRVREGYLKGTRRVQDKDKDKDTDKDKEGGVGETNDDWKFPDGWESPGLRSALDGWADMRRKIKKPVKSKESTSKLFKKFESADHLAEVAEFCEANGYQGLKPEYCKGDSRELSAAQRTARNAQSVLERMN